MEMSKSQYETMYKFILFINRHNSINRRLKIEKNAGLLIQNNLPRRY
ncbi:hypothetical protein VAE151_560025 [Vibrio aestuarianus]|uniref:Uncharacterized protein n=1 Tax=Vibrio aestuarianus TaxID=28171 RepID=A0ABM9FQU8_9VIBR|nr:hypothetical protein VAE308_1050673 [Vibrio aestuarianus]CAH8199327.1 hypothetical protein VIBAE_A31265 [Vibrio aestuarianus subsp. francensis]CAH8199815.1 hypothetical protein VAE055_380026 [Vibrio aestuarianus]CAH8199888.1 hypothetical protein VAE032_270668 [Vibrio aestuarianus]CAH8200026.1 hypothetical protein VAE128_460672 [Vibrio aestuarianus]